MKEAILILLFAFAFSFVYVYLINEGINFTQKSYQEKIEGFCGISTYGYCEGDNDCIVAGCSNQVCQNKTEQVFTTCDWKECYDYSKYGLSCKCISNKCQWSK